MFIQWFLLKKIKKCNCNLVNSAVGQPQLHGYYEKYILQNAPIL